MDEPKPLVQTYMDTFTRSKTLEERLQEMVEKLSGSEETLPCYVCNGQIVTDLD